MDIGHVLEDHPTFGDNDGAYEDIDLVAREPRGCALSYQRAETLNSNSFYRGVRMNRRGRTLPQRVSCACREDTLCKRASKHRSFSAQFGIRSHASVKNPKLVQCGRATRKERWWTKAYSRRRWCRI